jgi:hypothetical protein
MLEQGILLRLTPEGSVYNRRGLIFADPPASDGWAPVPAAATTTQAPSVRVPRGRSAPRRASATPPAPLSRIEQCGIDWLSRGTKKLRQDGRWAYNR